MRKTRSVRRISALCVSLVLLTAPAVRGQETSGPEAPEWASDPVGDIAYLSINGAIGGLTAGLWRELSGGSFTDGFARGALGGSAVYAGKRLAAESFFGAGFLGRGISSVGSSVVRNAADGRGLLEEVALPVGPIRLYATADDPTDPRVEVDLRDLYWTAYGLVEERLTLDLDESLSSGAPVFRADRPLEGTDDEPAGGLAQAGIIFLGPGAGSQDAEGEIVLPHERAHVIQHDFIYHVWLRPLEDRLARSLPWNGLSDRVDYDLVYPGLTWVASALGWSDGLSAPAEAEASFLETR